MRLALPIAAITLLFSTGACAAPGVGQGVVPSAGGDAAVVDTPMLMPSRAAQMASYPAEAVLDAFATACSGVEDLAVARASVLAAGWAETPVPADSDLGRVFAFGRTEAAKDSDATILDGGTFTKTVAGRDLALVLSGVELDADSRSTGCRIYDIDAPAPIAADVLENWAVRAPVLSTPVAGYTQATWNPGLKPGHMEMVVSYIAPGTQLPHDLPLYGLILIAQNLEFEF